MVSVTSLVLLFLIAPPTSARHGASTFVGGRLKYRQPPSLALSRASQSSGGRHSIPRTCVCGSDIECTQECSSNGARSLQTLALVRGGGGGNEAPVFTLLMRLFLPKYGRESETEEGGLDLEGGGVMRRLGRLVTGVFRKVLGSSSDSDTKGGEAVGKKIGKEQGKATTSSHLEKTFRPGNANYRIQKELKEFMANPPDNCKVSVGKNIRIWIITISGAEGTIYAGEKFRLRVAFPEDYPTKPPAVYFLQSPPPPKHQHIYTNGDICLSLLSSKDWKPNLTVMSLALSILSMLSSAKEKRTPEDNAAHADARPGQAQQWIYHDDLC